MTTNQRKKKDQLWRIGKKTRFKVRMEGMYRKKKSVDKIPESSEALRKFTESIKRVEIGRSTCATEGIEPFSVRHSSGD